LHNNKYQLLSILGEGGFSLTYRGVWKTEVQGALGKLPTDIPVCIKEFFFKDYCRRNPQTFFVETNNETAKEIFEKNKEKVIREARILSEIHHPNVVNVLEVFKQNNTVYIVMEFIAGHSLKQEIEQNGVFTENKLRPVIYKIGQALEYIHEKNILHLDIKPTNILITKSNNPKLIDFGISKRYDLASDQETSTTLQAASKGYASIEQYDSEAMQVFSPRPDIYSLGATMYFLLTGHTPTESILRASKGLQNPKELNPAISENTERVILKALELNASDRYETVTEMLLDWGYDPEKDSIDWSSLPADEDQSELMKKINEPLYDADVEDQTLITSLSINNKRKKKIKRWAAYSVAVILVCSAVILFFRLANNRSPLDNGIEPNPGIVEIESPVKSADTITQPEQNTISAEIPIVDPKQENYNKSFNNALTAFNAQAYEKALEFIKEAESYMVTEDTKRYKEYCKDELEKIETQKRKNSYDSLMEFGNFAVVKKKATGLYGAIDDKGNEVIECIYINTTPSGNNRLFQISDDLYDLYDASGKRLEAGISGLE
jgi:serine/threonine-protein kinase